MKSLWLLGAALCLFAVVNFAQTTPAPIPTNGAFALAITDATGKLLPSELPQLPWTILTGTVPNVSLFANDANYVTPAALTTALTPYATNLQLQSYALKSALPAVVAALPSTCTVGQLAFLTSATAGANLYGCTAANTWTAQGAATAVLPPPATAPGPVPTPAPSYTAPAKLTLSSPSAQLGASVTVTADHAVTWSLVSGSIGTLTPVSPTQATYTAPATAPQPQNAVGGCPVGPYDSVFNTRIDNLPVNANSAAWVAVTTNPVMLGADFGANIIDSSVPAANQTFYYTPAYNSAPFQIAPSPARFREMGSLTNDGGVNDHHLISVNHQTCQFYETYQDGNNGPNTAQSGYTYSGNSYAMPTSGTTDAAGLPLDPLVLHLSDIYSGEVKHALRFTLCTGCISSQGVLWPATGANGSNVPTTQAPPNGARFRLKASYNVTGIQGASLNNGGTGYTIAPTVTVSGCTVAPSVTAAVNATGNVSGLTIASPGSGCIHPTVAFSGVGTGAKASASVLPVPQQIVLTGLQRYGMILADNGGSGQIQMDADLTQDYSVWLPVAHISWLNIGITKNFEAVDESSLMLNPASIAVDATNQFQKPAAFAQILATDVSGNVAKQPIAVQPVTIGVQYQTITFAAGAPAYQIPDWVNGATNQQITWTQTSGPGSLTAAGVYTPPATVATLTPVSFLGASAQDGTATVIVKGNVIPTSADGSIRIDSGNFGNPYTDKAGAIWQPDLVAQENVSDNPINDGYPLNLWSSATVLDPYLYQYSASSQGSDLVYGPFVVPNGNYKITFASGIPNCSTTWTPGTWDGDLTFAAIALESQGQIQDTWNPVTAANSTCRVPVWYSFPAAVGNGVMQLAWRGISANNKHSVPLIGSLQISPDSTAPHLAINTQGVTSVNAGSTAHFSAVGWYMSNAVVWSVTGVGAIDTNGFYAAPATAAATDQTVTITATSTANQAISATATITVPAAPAPTPTPAPITTTVATGTATLAAAH